MVIGAVLTMFLLAIAGSMSCWDAGAWWLGLSVLCTAALWWLHLRPVFRGGRELARRLGVLFDAEPMEQLEGRQLEMFFL